jgi:tetratricopeptide (TPR) repeat protein
MKIKVKGERLKVKGLSLMVVILISALSFAQTSFDAANAAYADGRYEEAASIYQALIDEQPNATLYYNLGNAQFKRGELAQAILNYERALRLQPNNKDAKYNLAFAQSKITDNIAEQDFFLSVWVRAVRNSLKERTWLLLSICLFILALTGILVFLLSREPWLRKTAFHIAWIALLFSLVAGLNAASLHKRDTLRNEAIITQGVVNAKSSPDRSGTDLFTLHEGTKVEIRETLGEWVNVRVGSNEGWIRLMCLERI